MRVSWASDGACKYFVGTTITSTLCSKFWLLSNRLVLSHNIQECQLCVVYVAVNVVVFPATANNCSLNSAFGSASN